MDVSFPSGVRQKRKTKLCERIRSAQYITIHEDRWKVLVVFTGMNCKMYGIS